MIFHAKGLTCLVMLIVFSGYVISAQKSELLKEKPCPQETLFPDGKQTSLGSALGQIWTNPSMVKTEWCIINASYDDVWNAANSATLEFERIGKRPRRVDEEKRRITNSNIDDIKNAKRNLIPASWTDELLTEITQLDETRTKISVARKVYEKRTGPDPNAWSEVGSNGKIEKWILAKTALYLKTSKGKLPSPTARAEQIAKSEVITNDLLIEMVKAGLSESLIKSKIKKSMCRFDTDTRAIIRLKENRVSESLINFILVEHVCDTPRRIW